MKLSSVAPCIQVSVIRDGEFENLGFLFDHLAGKLVFAESRQFLREVIACRPACVIAAPDLAPSLDAAPGLAVSAEPRRAFFKLHAYLLDSTDFYGSACPTIIHRSARIHPRAVIANTGVEIGEDADIGANVVIEPGTRVGSRVRIQPGAVLGSEGFQTARAADRLLQLRHAGGIVVEDDVEIFANAVVARAPFRQRTRVGESSRLGNGCFVSHNVQLGRRCFVGHNAVINGNTIIGDDCWIGPNASVSNLLTVGSGSRITMGAAVIQSLQPGSHVTGIPAGEHRRMLRHRTSIG